MSSYLIQKLRYREFLKSYANATVLNDGDYELITDNNEIIDRIDKRLNPPKQEDNIIILPCINEKQEVINDQFVEKESESCLD